MTTNIVYPEICCMKLNWCVDCNKDTTYFFSQLYYNKKPVYLSWCAHCKNKTPHLISKL